MNQRFFRELVKSIVTATLVLISESVIAVEPDFLPLPQRTEDFASFCNFVETEYAYFDVKSVDWKRACDFYASKVGSATTRNAYISLLETALGELYDAHAHLGTNTATSPRLVPSQTDLMARWSGEKALITDVRASSIGAKTGIRPGVEITSIHGEPIETAVASLMPKFLRSNDPAAREWALQVALAGRRDRATVALLTKASEETRVIEFAPVFNAKKALLSHQRLGAKNDVGYIRIHNSLGNAALVQTFDDALAILQGVHALVLDLRDTPSGGNSSVARGILGRFVASSLPYQRHELVSEFRATGIRRAWVEYVSPRAPLPAFKASVVVLVGPWTGSMGEGLAIGFDAAIGAPVVGRPMAHLLGALGEQVLPHSKIVVRVPTEKLFHVNGTPREAFVPCALIEPARAVAGDDWELQQVVRWAASLPATHASNTSTFSDGRCR